MKPGSVRIKVKVVRTVDEEMLKGLFIGACEGGSNYWCKELAPLGKDKDAYYAMFDGFTLIEKENGKKHRVTKTMIKQACQLFSDQYPDRFAQSIGGYGDVEDGDIFLQLCTFGECIYG